MALLLPAGAAAQQRLRVEGDLGHPAARALREVAERDGYLLLARDTVLPEGARIEGDVVIVDALVRLAGTVEGSVAVVGGALFLRPGARVGGRVVSVHGTVLSSDLATVGDTLGLPQDFRMRLSREGERFTVHLEAPDPPPLVAPSGLFGLGIPTYDRVNGLTLRAGVVMQVRADSADPRLHLTAIYRTQPGAFGGTAGLRVMLQDRWSGIAAAGREALTPDQWIRGDLANSLAAFFLASDLRDYHLSDYVSVGLERLAPEALQSGQGFVAPRVALRASRDRSLEVSDPWTVLNRGEPWRPNPPVFEGTLTSAVLGAATGWRGVSTQWSGDVALEWAFPSPVGQSWGEREFRQVVGDGHWNMLGLWGHTASVRAHLQHTLWGEQAPPQRWSLLGGSGTLPTLEPATLRGDNLIFVQSTYAVPLALLTAPFAGPPSLAVRHAVGTAWPTGSPIPSWEQSLGLGLQFRMLEAFVFVDPARPSTSPRLSVGLSFPR